MSKNSLRTSPIPRGIRNNNPLNIRIGNTWLGEVPDPTDSEFEQFVSARYGLRAGFCILRRYIKRYGKNTIAKIIPTWAPSSENDVESYIRIVCTRSKLERDAILSFDDKPTMCALVSAMCVAECGQTIPFDIIESSYDIA